MKDAKAANQSEVLPSTKSGIDYSEKKDIGAVTQHRKMSGRMFETVMKEMVTMHKDRLDRLAYAIIKRG